MAVNPADIATALDRPTPGATSRRYRQWVMWINDARRLIANRLGDLTLLDQDTLDYVVREAVVARVRGGGGVTSETVAVDDGTVTKRWENGSASSGMRILDEWWDLFNTNSYDHDAFTIQPFPDRINRRAGFLDDVGWRP